MTDKKHEDRARAQHKLAGEAAKLGEDVKESAPASAERIEKATEEVKVALHGFDAPSRDILGRAVTIVEQALALYQETRADAQKYAAEAPPMPAMPSGMGDFMTLGEYSERNKAEGRLHIAKAIFINSFCSPKTMDPKTAFMRADEFIVEADAVLADARKKDQATHERACKARADLFDKGPAGAEQSGENKT